MQRAFRTPLAVAAAVALGYLLWTGWYVHHHPVRTLAYVSPFFQGRHGGSASIARIPPTAGNTFGYDGQFYYYIAADPFGARPYLDNAAYRYSRPVYPLAAKVVALDRESALPWSLLLVGIAGAALGTWALATFVLRRGVSAWYGAVFGVYPGLFQGVSHDLVEPLAYGIVALGLLAWFRERPRLWTAAACFGLAGATRETTLLFPVVIGLWLALRDRRLRDSAVMLGVSLAPYIVIKVALFAWLDSFGQSLERNLEPVPFLGLVHQWPWSDYSVQQILAVVVPGLLAVAVAWWAIRRVTLELALLAANVLVLVVLLPGTSYVNYLASGRIATGVVVAFVLCLPAVVSAGRVAQAWLPIALWLTPWYSVLPEAVRR
jgi:hypothetical protein